VCFLQLIRSLQIVSAAPRLASRVQLGYFDKLPVIKNRSKEKAKKVCEELSTFPAKEGNSYPYVIEL